MFLRFKSLGLLRPDSGAARKEIPRAQGPRNDEERRDLRLPRGTIQYRLARAHALRRRQISMNLLNSCANSI